MPQVLRRRDRRLLARRAGLPWSAVTSVRPQVRVLKNLFYWRGLDRFGEQGHFHVFSHCRRLAAEWAGRDGLTLGHANHAFGSKGVCPECVTDMQRGRTA